MISLAVATLAGPWGPFHLAATRRGIVAAEWGVSRAAFESILRRRFRAEPVADPKADAMLDAATPTVELVIAGAPVDASVVPLDLADRPDFDQRVLLAVRAVPWGATVSYGEIARQVGAPRAARAVGGAVGRNPIALLIPCHRVIAADGSLGGYGGDGAVDRADALERKRSLLLREGVTVGLRSG